MKLTALFISLCTLAILMLCCTRTSKPTTDGTLSPTLPPATQVSDNQLLGQWMLQEVRQEKIIVKPGTFIKIMDTGYHLYAGCNNINGELTATKNEVTFYEGSTTMMACDGMQYEQKFADLLRRTSGYKITGDVLHLKTRDGALLIWKKVVASEQLVGKKLKVIGLTINGGVQMSSTAPMQFLNFQAGGNMTGSAGCNYINGTYEITGNFLFIKGLMSSKMACAEQEKQAYEAALIQHLSNTPLTIEYDPAFITLRDKNGAIAIQLSKE